MAKKSYRKDNHRLSIKFIDANTNNQLFEIEDKAFTELGDFYSDVHVDRLIKQVIDENNLPDNVLVLTIGDFKLR